MKDKKYKKDKRTFKKKPKLVACPVCSARPDGRRRSEVADIEEGLDEWLTTWWEADMELFDAEGLDLYSEHIMNGL